MSFPSPTAKQARILWFSVTALAVAMLATLVGLLVWGLGFVLSLLSGVLMPVGCALILAYILDPVVNFFERKIPRLWAVCLVFLLTALFMAGVLSSFVPSLLRETRRLADEMPKNIADFRERTDNFIDKSPWLKQLPIDLNFLLPSRTNNVSSSTNSTAPASQSTNAPATTETNNALQTASTSTAKGSTDSSVVGTILPMVQTGAVAVARWFTAKLTKVTGILEFLIGIILVPVYLFYFLLEKDHITHRWKDYLPVKESHVKDEIVFVLKAINDCMIVFFRGQVLVAMCVGVLITIGYLILGLNYAVLLGLVAGVLGIVPYLGTITSLVLALLFAGFQFGDWLHPMLVLMVASIVKLLEDLVISPRIMGKRAGLHPAVTIFAVMAGTVLLGGFLGAMLAIPLTAALKTIMFRYIWKKGK